jgi:hypothetical protein
MGKKRSCGSDQPDKTVLLAKKAAESRHPLIGWMKGTFTIPEGVDLTEPACPEWADLIDQMLPLPHGDKASGS